MGHATERVTKPSDVDPLVFPFKGELMRDHDRDREFGRELEGEAKGIGNQVKGKVKEEFGDLTGDRSTELEGKIEKNVGKVQRGLNNPSDTMSRDWDEDETSESGRSGSIDSGDRSRGSSGMDRSSGSEVDRSRESDRGRSGSKDRSGY
jgi:uncharacterized protein YjbJ (UPF0337 family)